VRKLSLVRRVSLLAVGVAALVGVLFAAALIAILALRNANARESHSKDVTVATLRVRTVSADLDSALRGYVLSGNKRFLTLFSDAHARVPNEIGHLRTLVRHDAPQRLRAANAAQELHLYLTDYALNVIAIAQISRAAAAGPAAGSEGKRRTDEIRRTLNELLTV
jgi:CHASE3 domain sensor protein